MTPNLTFFMRASCAFANADTPPKANPLQNVRMQGQTLITAMSDYETKTSTPATRPVLTHHPINPIPAARNSPICIGESIYRLTFTLWHRVIRVYRTGTL